MAALAWTTAGLGALAAVATAAMASDGVPNPATGEVRGYPTCNAAQPGPPTRDNSCRAADPWGGVFLFPHEHHLLYKVCIRRPDRSIDCYRRRTFRYGHRQEDGMASTAEAQTGVFRLTWKVPPNGVIDRATLRIR